MGDDTIKKNISKNIAKYRESAGLSQKELANKLGVVPSRISNWETGANCPTIDILFEVCEVLGVSINDIYGVYPDSKFVLKYGEQDLLKKYRTLDSHAAPVNLPVLSVLKNSVRRLPEIFESILVRLMCMILMPVGSWKLLFAAIIRRVNR